MYIHMFCNFKAIAIQGGRILFSFLLPLSLLSFASMPPPPHNTPRRRRRRQFLYNNFEVFLFYFRCSQRTGHVRVLSFKLAIAILCQGPLEEKYRCKFLLLTYCAHAHQALEPKLLSSNSDACARGHP